MSTSESSAGTGTSSPSTPTTTSQSRLIASSPTLISGITSPPLLDSIKTIQGHGLLGPPKSERGRKKIKAENPGGPPVLVVPYPILASGETAKEGKTYRWGSWWEGSSGLGTEPGASGLPLEPSSGRLQRGGAQRLERGGCGPEGWGLLTPPTQNPTAWDFESLLPSLFKQYCQPSMLGSSEELFRNASARAVPPEILI